MTDEQKVLQILQQQDLISERVAEDGAECLQVRGFVHGEFISSSYPCDPLQQAYLSAIKAMTFLSMATVIDPSVTREHGEGIKLACRLAQFLSPFSPSRPNPP